MNTTTMAAAHPMKQCRAQQAVVVGEQQLQQQQHSSSHKSDNCIAKNGQSNCPTLVIDQHHHNFRHQQKRQQQRTRDQFQQQQQQQPYHHYYQQQHQHLPAIVHQEDCNAVTDDGKGPQNQQQKRVGAARGGGGGFSSSSSSSTTVAAGAEAAAAIIVVDPPRPPFIPKKPVLNGNATAAVAAAEHHHPHHHSRPHHHPHHHHNRIYAQANAGGCGVGAAAAVVNSTTTAMFDNSSNSCPANGTKVMITQTTTTYIGGGTTATGPAATTNSATTAGLRRITTKSPPLSTLRSIEMVDDDTKQYSSSSNGWDSDQKCMDHHSQQYRNGEVKTMNGTNGANSSNNNNRNSFGTESSFSAGSSTVVSAAADQDLHYSVTGMISQSNSNNNVEKVAGTNRPQRRLSLVGGVAVKLPDYQRLPISSFGCTTDGHGREGRIYATTAAALAGTNSAKCMIKKNSAAPAFVPSTGATFAGHGTMAAVNNGGGTSGFFGLRNGVTTATSQMCLNGASAADGKSTLSRRAQKLAQKAAHKLTIGSLSSELSSSASALYSLFTSSAENGIYAAGGGKASASAATELGIYAEAGSCLGPEHFYHDKAPLVSAHTSRGIDFLERFGQFAKERALIEEEYASKLKSLAKRSRGKKNEDNDEAKMYTTTMAFQTMLAEIESLASQHEVIGERLRSELWPQLTDKCRLLRTSRKKLYQDFEMMEKNLQSRVEELAKQKKNYEKAHLDAQGAHVKCAKAEKNMYITRIDLEKARQNVNTKSSICEQSKQNYAAQLGATNQSKYEHYNIMMPQLLEQMRQLDIERIEFTKKAMLDCVRAETGVLNIIQRCYSDMNSAIGTINPEKDTVAVVEQTKSGFSHPLDYQFEDLGDPADILQDGTESFDGSTIKRQSDKGKSANGKGNVPRKQSLKLFGTSNNGKSNGSGAHGGPNCGASGAIGGAGEYGTLPPQQRCRKIQQKLEELEAELNIKDQSQAGMQRMHVAYSQNPQLGDPAKVAEQLLQNQQEMHALQQQIQRFKELLQIAQGELNQPLGASQQHQAQSQHHYATAATAHSSPGSSPRGSAGSAGGKLKNGHHPQQNGGRFNGGTGGDHQQQQQQLQQHRASSYSEVSSISSADGGSMLLLTMTSNGSGGGGGGGLPSTNATASGRATATVPAGNASSFPHLQHHLPSAQQMNNGGPNAFHQSASGAMLSAAAAATTAIGTAPQMPSSQCHQQQPVAAVQPSSQLHNNNTAGSTEFYEECDTPAAAVMNGAGGGGCCPTAVVPPQQQSDIVLGTAIAMYAYEATSDEVGGTTISMRNGDELLLLERDVGDGWTRVRHMQSNAEGFVPTSYLECKWYSTDG